MGKLQFAYHAKRGTDDAVITVLHHISVADNSNNSSNPDTSMKFGKNHPYVILFQNQS